MADDILNDPVLQNNLRYLGFSDRGNKENKIEISQNRVQGIDQNPTTIENGRKEGELVELNSNFEKKEKSEIELNVIDNPKEQNEVTVPEGNYNYPVMYDDAYGQGAISQDTIKDNVNFTPEEVEKRIRNRSKELELFLYNLLPYVGTEVYSQTRGLAEGDIYPTSVVPLLSTISNGFRQLRYLSVDEIIKISSLNFYTLHLTRGIKVKGQIRSAHYTAMNTEEWTGQPDVYWGSNTKVGRLQRALAEAAQNFQNVFSTSSLENGNAHAAEVKKDFETEITLGENISNTRGKSFEPFDFTDDDLIGNKTRSYKNEVDIRVLNFDSTGKANVTEESGLVFPMLRNKTKVDQIGYVRAKPIIHTGFEDQYPHLEIPFEFNPEISEGSIEAQYQATQIVSRIGDLQSYIRTGSITVSLETAYLATAGSETDDVTGGQGWMSYFTLKRIQEIEMAYRSLVYPHFPDEEEIETGYRYIKPPLIKIVIGDPNGKENAPFTNLLTYWNERFVENRFKASGNRYGSKMFRNFIATGVEIKKDLTESPIILDNDYRPLDTIGFKVSVNLVEVSPSYADAPPDSLFYYNRSNLQASQG